MQTFLPFKEFDKSAAVLDIKRLGNQRNECTVVLTACLTGPNAPWYNHACSRMWRGYEYSLLKYSKAILNEWLLRGYKNKVTYDHFSNYFRDIKDFNAGDPPWLGDERVHSSHRSALLRKKPDFYGNNGWVETGDLEMFWPV